MRQELAKPLNKVNKKGRTGIALSWLKGASALSFSHSMPITRDKGGTGMNEIVVLVTAPSQEEACILARALVSARLVACASLLPEVTSVFSWEGELSEEKETLLILKSKRSLFEQIEAKIKALHSYAVPEIIALPVLAGSESYLRWLHENTR